MMLFLMAGLQQGHAQEMLLKKAVDSLQTVVDQNLPDSVKAIINDSTIADEELMKDINKEVSLLVDSTLITANTGNYPSSMAGSSVVCMP